MSTPSEPITTDFLVVGAGVAGLRAAITLAEAGNVLVLAKDRLEESNSQWAQGGIAVVLSDDDEIELHEADTIAAGDGLCDRDAVRTLVEEGPAEVQLLMHWNTHFDRQGTRLLFAREGAHSRSRVLHAHGDSTGREMTRALYAKAASLSRIRFESFAAVTDLLLNGGEVAGALAFDGKSKHLVEIRARAVLLATGGLGRVYRETTNPDVATGDGVAMAYRAGAKIADIEFVQFHPTALHLEGVPRFLLSEALRGEGAFLRNAAGERFMAGKHPMAELAPRDVVSRAIFDEMERTGEPHMWLDLTHLDGIASRFPRIYETCKAYGIDLVNQPAPVHPAAHYAMGGVRTDLQGRTSVPRLFAAGEVACTGVHGANRLASNSLLEGVVFGARAARAMREWAGRPAVAPGVQSPVLFPGISEEQVRAAAWKYAGVRRTADGLRAALGLLGAAAMSERSGAGRLDFEVRNMHEVASLIARCALARQESRGGHYRLDFPHKQPEYQKHSLVRRDSLEVAFES